MAVWTINAQFDPEAQVWYTIDGDMPSLFVDAESIDELARKASSMLLDLLEINADLFPAEKLQGDHSIRVVAHDERVFAVAA